MPETMPPADPMIVRLPLIRFFQTEDGRVIGQVQGSVATIPGNMNGTYLGPNGYTADVTEATDFRGEAGKTIVQGQAVPVTGPKGDAGADGKSALQIWQEAGHAGGEAAFLAAIKGDPGAQGPTGSTGAQGAQGDVGATGAKGDQGERGPTGAQGVAGPQGVTGAKGDTGSMGAQGAKGDAGSKGDTGAAGATGAKGDAGAAGATLIGQVAIGQTAAISIALGIREVTAAIAGTVVGERYACFVRSYRLNGGASAAGRPSGYAVLDCVCNTAGQITVSLNAPLLAIGASYALTCDIVRINA